MLKVVINGLSARRGGGQVYLSNLLQHAGRYGDMQIYLFAPDSPNIVLDHCPNIKQNKTRWPVANPILRSGWEKIMLPRFLKEVEADILFCPGGLLNGPVPEGCRTVITFQNMIPFNAAVRAQYGALQKMRNWLLERAYTESMARADRVIFISNFAKEVIDRLQPVSGKSVMVPNGVDGTLFSAVAAGAKPQGLPQEYFLYVSIFDFYKKQLEVVRGYHLLRKRRMTGEKLVLAGDHQTPYGQIVKKEIANLGLQNEVILTGDVSHRDLPGLMHHSKLNLFASECENCPYILLEALAVGRPLLVSKCLPMPEFGGDAVIYFDPSSPQDLAEKMLALVDDAAALNALAIKAKQRAGQYRSDQSALQTWDAIRSVA